MNFDLKVSSCVLLLTLDTEALEVLAKSIKPLLCFM